MKDYATTIGTYNYFKRSIRKNIPPSHFRKWNKFFISSIGLGTHLGEPTKFVDILYMRAFVRLVDYGCNVIDTSINYRNERSEKCIGSCLKHLFEKSIISRNEIIICTKGGFLAPSTMRFIRKNSFPLKNIINGHCIYPKVLENQIETSLKNLNLECIDFYYINGPDRQLQEMDKEEFYKKIENVFEMFEDKVQENKIQMYGIAAEGFTFSDQNKTFDIERLFNVAKKVGGRKHHFRVIQFPYNLIMKNALNLKNQKIGNKYFSVIEAAKKFNIYTFSNWPLFEGKISNNPIEAIQFARSTPGIGTVLVGMKKRIHIEQNIKLFYIPPSRKIEFYKKINRIK